MIREHIPSEPMKIGVSEGLVYCKACGYLLESPRGPAKAMTRACTPVRVGLR